jgi:uncharacterized protein YndB with AHSA1/START domain
MTDVQQEGAIRVSRRFTAPREQVFAAWTDPDVLKRWWKGAPDFETPLAEVDPRAGGAYRLKMTTPAGEVHSVHGEYTEVRPPERLAFTWAWEGLPGVSQVVVDFIEDGGGTEVVIVHTGLAEAESRGQHEQGWNAVLASLDRELSA